MYNIYLMKMPFRTAHEAIDYHLTNAPVVWKAPRNLAAMPSASFLRANTKEAFEQMFEAAADLLPSSYQNRLGRAFIHEGQHVQAAELMGLSVSHAGLAIVRQRWHAARDASEFVLKPFVSIPQPDASPLERAAVEGYPEVPSRGDYQSLRALGFVSVDVLGDAIRNHNRTLDSSTPPLPLPLAYTS